MSRLFFLCIFLTRLSPLISQEVYEVEILHADSAIMETVNGEMLKKLIRNVQLRHKTNLIDCDTAIIYQNNNIDAFGHVVLRKKNTKIQGEFLQYFSNQKLAVLNRNVILTDKKAKLYTEDMTYDMNSDQGYYMKGGRLVNDKTIITSQFGTYYGTNSQVLFRQNVYVNHPDYKLKSDSLMYDTKKKRSIFKTSTNIENDSGYIWCNSGWYDEENNQSSFGKGTYIYQPTSWMLTDSIFYDKKNGRSTIYKTFEYHDTASKVHVFGDTAIMLNDNKDIIAYRRPTMILESSDNKPTFVRAEVLESKTKGKFKQMNAIKKVRIFNNEFQGTSDTMHYIEQDSLMIMRGSPIIWYAKSQVTGERIEIFLRDKKPHKMDVYHRAFLVEEEEVKNHYNQISSDTIKMYFKEGKIDLLYAYSHAKSIYYGKEEGKGYLGINSSESYSLKANFDSSKVKKIVFYREPKAIFIPVKDITDGNSRLPDMMWKEGLRPKNKDDI